MTTLKANTPRAKELGDENHVPVVASDVVYEGAAVGRVRNTGYARPLQDGDKFAGFALQKADNSVGAAGAVNVRVLKRGQVQLSVDGAVVTDVGQPVYAADDNTFQFLPFRAVYVGYVKRYVSAGVVVVVYDADVYRDPYAPWAVRERLTLAKTFDARDTGKAFFVTEAGDDDKLTFPIIGSGLENVLIVAIGAYGTTKLELASSVADAFQATDLSATTNKDLLLTKATQQRGDCALVVMGDADGYMVTLGNIALGQASTWTKEA